MSRVHSPDRAAQTVTFLLAGSLLLGGCQSDRTAPAGRQPGPSPGPATGRVQPGSDLAREDFPNRGRLVEDLSIGLVEGAAEYIFGFIGDIAIGPGGGIFVADSRAGIVREYDGQGRFVRGFGRRGTGPGEFNAPVSVAVHPDGRVLIGDEGTSGWVGADRIHVFSREGTHLDTWVVTGLIEPPITVDTAGRIYVRMNGEIPSNGEPVTRPRETPGASLVTPAARALTWTTYLHAGESPTSPGGIRLGSDGTVLDTIVAPALPAVSYWQHVPSGARVYLGVRYTPISWWAWSPVGHLLSGSSGEYAIRVHEAERTAGTPLRHLRRDLAPIPVVADEREETRAAIDAIESGPEHWVGAVEVPTYKPAYHSVFVSRQGSVWVGVHLPSVRRSGEWHEPMTAFDVWQPNGDYYGRIEGPSSIRGGVIDGDALVTKVRDELGVERVVRYRVEWE